MLEGAMEEARCCHGTGLAEGGGEQGQVRKIKGAGVTTAATLLITPFPVLIRPGPPLPGAQAGLPRRFWRYLGDPSMLASDLCSRLLPQKKTLSLTHIKSFLGLSDPFPCLLSRRPGLRNKALLVCG